MSRPEHTAPPEIFYNEDEATKYTSNSRIISIQNEMAWRALELLALPEDEVAFVLDIGCGSGLSGEVLEEEGHVWVGMDISDSMLEVAKEREVDGDLFLQDIGQGVGFRAGTFDGAISISVIQWLCNADKTVNNPRSRLKRFFSTLYSSLARGARAVFQFYPENPEQIEMIISSAMKAGFTGGLVVDFPNSSKAKKYYLCLFAGYKDNAKDSPALPKALGEGDEGVQVNYASKRVHTRRKEPVDRKAVKDKKWVQHKKELNRARGKDTPLDSKYTARKRRTKF
ncbi:Williams Beuren syndrome chromosome region 22 protein [Geranomyces variabilis]|uniref:Williams Beuren syndrome chromosome region 22 protein n=1 Tax=Geranomyces variabilis TaxID=109894 RepID=A0AAD5TJW3_9FUNG|nr:Williams Beuren syndrome chromosome region 22 protein [Geranomyces variabilis]